MRTLGDTVLVVARARAFWTTPYARTLFPRRILLPARPGKLGYVFFTPYIVLRICIARPRVLVLGTTMPYAQWFAWAKRHGLFPRLKGVTDNQFLSSRDAQAFEAVWVYSPEEILLQDEPVRSRFHFFPYPSSAQLVPIGLTSSTPHPYIFCGGSHQRDFNSFLRAVSGMPFACVLVTDRGITAAIPQNVTVYGRMPMQDYMTFMAHALFVVVPLKKGIMPHGHGDISAALSLGKPVITTQEASVGEYVTHGVEGLLVPPENSDAYRAAIKKLAEDESFRKSCAVAAQKKATTFSYETFAKNIHKLISSVAKKV